MYDSARSDSCISLLASSVNDEILSDQTTGNHSRFLLDTQTAENYDRLPPFDGRIDHLPVQIEPLPDQRDPLIQERDHLLQTTLLSCLALFYVSTPWPHV